MARRLGLAALLALLATAPAAAQERDWSATRIHPDREVIQFDVDVTSSGTDETVVAYSVSRHPDRPAVHAAVKSHGGSFDAPQLLDIDSFYATVDGSIAGGAVAAWYHEPTEQVRVAELASGERTFGAPLLLASTQTNYSYGRPQVAVSDTGAAAVLYLARGPVGHVLMAITRPAGGSFGEPELVAGPVQQDDIYARDVAVGGDGTAVAGFVLNGRAAVAVRSPDGPWGIPQPLGEPAPEHSWQSPRVGIDGAGNVAAAWLEGAPINDTGPVKVAFRPSGGVFGSPRNTGLRATSLDRIRLGVSAPGELVLAMEASTSSPYGGTYIQGIHALYGNTARQVIGEPARLAFRGSYPSLGFNERGDAAVVWDECCPLALRARRRPPLGSFGPVADVQPPIEFEGARSGRWVLDADIDDFGNGRATWVDSEPEPNQVFVGEDGPLIADEPPPVPEPGPELPPVVQPEPEPDPDEAGGEPAPDPGHVDYGPYPGPWGPDGMPPPPPPAPGTSPAGTAPADTRRPRLSLALGRRLRGVRRPRVPVTIRCNEVCGIRLAGTVGRTRLRPIVVIAQPGVPLRVALPLPRRGARGLVRIRGVATDLAGNVDRAARRGRLLPPRRR